MRIADVHLHEFRRFKDLTIQSIPVTARLVILAGPNGTGKSSLFDAFRTWQASQGGANGFSFDETYHRRAGAPEISWPDEVTITTHEPPISANSIEAMKAVYIREAAQ